MSKEDLQPQPPWQPGQSGNPNGSSKKQRFTSELLRLLDEKPERIRSFVRVGWKAAMKADYRFWQAILERVDGKIPDIEPQAELSMEEAAKRVRDKRAKRKPKAE